MTEKDFIQECFDDAKTDIIVLQGKCIDCNKDVSLEIEMNEIGKFTVSGGAFDSSDKAGQRLKCDDCFEKDSSFPCGIQCEVYSRVVGYLRPVQQWNLGKKEEFKERLTFKI